MRSRTRHSDQVDAEQPVSCWVPESHRRVDDADATKPSSGVGPDSSQLLRSRQFRRTSALKEPPTVPSVKDLRAYLMHRVGPRVETYSRTRRE